MPMNSFSGDRKRRGGVYTVTQGDWEPDEAPPGDSISLIAARDAVVRCFTATHGPRFAQARQQLGQDASEDAVRESVETLLRLAFRQAGGSYDSPTRDDLVRVVDFLAERSLEWGVPAEVVFENHCETTRMLGRVTSES